MKTPVLSCETAEQSPRTGNLKIFFGYAPGVGKNRAMLAAALREQEHGVDVVAGPVSPRALALLPHALETLSGASSGELALDEALLRRPRLLVLENLAHDNPPTCRHSKRYQDVQELLRAGIDVFATLNVQQLESLNDVVASITGTASAERIPDHVFDTAASVVLVDLEPRELLERACAESACPPEDLERKKATLTALREIAFRRSADRLERTTQVPVRAKASEHILICLSGAPSNARVIRTAARMAEAFHGAFTALFVETSSFSSLKEEDRQHLQANLHLAEELGARIATVYGDDPAIQISEYAKLGGVSKIVLGRSPQRRSLLPGSKSLMDRLEELAPDLDIYIIPDQPKKRQLGVFPVKERFSMGDVLRMLGILALCTGVGFFFTALSFTTANVIMVYILGVLAVAMVTSGRSYSLLASLLSVLIFNFFFTAPYFSLLSKPNYVATFGVMFLVALLGSSLTARIKHQAVQSAGKAYRTEVLLETSRKLQKAEDTTAILTATATQLRKLLRRDLLFYPVGEDGTLLSAMRFPAPEGSDLALCETPLEREAALWVLHNNKHAGATTHTLPAAQCLYLAVRSPDQVLAVAGISLRGSPLPDTFEQNLIMAILDECGLAMEKERVSRAKQKIEETARQEALRANLLRAISHDLRTPLTSISGNAAILMESGEALESAKRQKLYGSIYDDSLWLIHLVENLLSITRIENGAIHLHLQPELLDEVFGEALNHLDRGAAQHTITLLPGDDLLMADMDAQLIVQVVVNLLNNAVKYTPNGSHITLSAQKDGALVRVEVGDDGPGVPDAAKAQLFEMFYTANNTRGDGRRGLGLGLSLCRAIVTAHGGSITVSDNHPQGTIFAFTLRASEVDSHE